MKLCLKIVLSLFLCTTSFAFSAAAPTATQVITCRDCGIVTPESEILACENCKAAFCPDCDRDRLACKHCDK